MGAATVPMDLEIKKTGINFDSNKLSNDFDTMAMKRFLYILSILFFVGCSSIRVFSDFDAAIEFDQYQSFAFFKPGIKDVEISDLDKTRILRSIEKSMTAKGMVVSDQPDLLVNIAVKATDRVTISNNNFGWGWGWGWGWNPWGWGGNMNTISTSTRGELFIDFIDAKSKRLVWQGKGYGGISEYSKNRDEKIDAFVQAILNTYPPEKEGQ